MSLPPDKHISLSPFTPKRLRRLAIICSVIAGLGLFYWIFDPGSSKYAPKCIIRLLTGFDCPGCGSQRMLHACLHANFSDAFEANPFLLIIAPFLLAWIWIDCDPSTYPKASRLLNSTPFILVLLAIVAAWGILRNIL